MRARRRRSVLNTISAAALEVAIMGIFVIIAQPQLRDALFEILQVDPAHGSVQATTQPASSNVSAAEVGFNLEYYPGKIEQMVGLQANTLFFNGYITFLFGSRK